MATAFPSHGGVIPVGATFPVMPGPLLAGVRSGVVQVRDPSRETRTFTITYLIDFNTSTGNGREFLVHLERYWIAGTFLALPHPTFTLLGDGGGTPVVKGASQTGNTIDTDGWPNNTAVLKGGDIVTFDGDSFVYFNRLDVTSDGSGNATLNITPRMQAANSPADNAPITITDSVVFTCKIVNITTAPYGPAGFTRMAVTFQETRE